LSDKDYLGDGVYAEIERGMIKLTTEREYGTQLHVIYLEPEVYEALVGYFERIKRKYSAPAATEPTQ
jgi:hypothetical protein